MVATTEGDVAKHERGACTTTHRSEHLGIDDEGESHNILNEDNWETRCVSNQYLEHSGDEGVEGKKSSGKNDEWQNLHPK